MLLVLLLCLLGCWLPVGGSWNYEVTGDDGTVYILSVSKKVSTGSKKEILAADGAEAYNKFMQQYGGTLETPRLMMSGDPTAQNDRESKRKRNFATNLAALKRHNREKFATGQSKYEATINAFAVTDADDRRNFLGASGNLTSGGGPPPIDERKLEPCRDRLPEATCNTMKLQGKCAEGGILVQQCEMTCGKCGAYKLPEYLDWSSRGMVTQAKAQGKCGACWAFAANVVIEWIFQKTTANQLQFSEQELLDCTYPDTVYKNGKEVKKNACFGGLPHEAWGYVKKRGGLSPMAEYPYVGVDGICLNYETFEERFGNPIKGAFKLNLVTMLPRNFDKLVIEALNVIPLSVALYVNPDLGDGIWALGEGIYDGCPPGIMDMNHAVTLIGYGPNYYTFKNSWGPDWGVNGFGKIFRAEGANMCGILNYVYYTDYTDLNPDDGIEDFPREAVYDDEQEAATCEDVRPSAGECPHWASLGYCDTGFYITYMRTNCKRSCNLCEEEVVVVECEPGYFKRGPGCIECPENTYNSDPLATECALCPSGSSSDAGSASEDDCEECGPGYFLDGSTCEQCPENTYSGHGATQCASCPDGTRSRAGSKLASDCKSPPDGCKDAYPVEECEQWLEQGVCKDERHNFLTWACKKTCVFCIDEEEEEEEEEEGNCVDSDPDECPGWADLGYCESASKYSEWMIDNCRLSCGRCGGSCADLDPENCPGWARKGFCDSGSEYSEWMMENCQASCESCEGGDGGDDCVYDDDTSDYCAEWKADGECTQSSLIEYMRDTCSTTCKLCPIEEEATEESDSDDGSSNCASDRSSDCAEYANRGYCSHYSYKAWMEENCPSTCRVGCTGSCQDNNQHCASWASGGECSRNPYYMKSNCRASCGFCSSGASTGGGGSSSCGDYNSYCSSWQQQGYCQAGNYYYDYMKQYCPSSCNMCSSSGGGTQGGGSGGGSCYDSSTDCPYWASTNQCSYNPGYMNVYCKKSCGLCGGGGGGYQGGGGGHSSCSDHSSYAGSCGYWAQTGQCSYNPGFMLQYCKRSCNRC